MEKQLFVVCCTNKGQHELKWLTVVVHRVQAVQHANDIIYTSTPWCTYSQLSEHYTNTSQAQLSDPKKNNLTG